MGPDAAADAACYGRIPPRAGAGQARDRQGEARGSGGNRAGEAGDRTGVAGGTSRYRTRATGALQPAERAASADRKTQEGNSETAAQPNAGEPEADGAATARDARRVDADLVGFEHRVGADAPSAQPSEARLQLQESSPASLVGLDGKKTGIITSCQFGRPLSRSQLPPGRRPVCPAENGGQFNPYRPALPLCSGSVPARPGFARLAWRHRALRPRTSPVRRG